MLPFRMLLLVILMAAGPVRAQFVGGEVPLADVLEVIVLEGQILAIDASGGGQLREDLHLDEKVIWSSSRGRVGAVITDERLLVASVGASSWREIRFERAERLPERAQLGDRVGLVVTTHRIIGFESGSGRVFEHRLGPREGVLATQAGGNVVVVVTSRKVLGLSPEGGFVETRMQLKEKLRDVSVRSNVATVRTDRRLLIFRGPTRSWSEQRLDLRQSG